MSMISKTADNSMPWHIACWSCLAVRTFGACKIYTQAFHPLFNRTLIGSLNIWQILSLFLRKNHLRIWKLNDNKWKCEQSSNEMIKTERRPCAWPKHVRFVWGFCKTITSKPRTFMYGCVRAETLKSKKPWTIQGEQSHTIHTNPNNPEPPRTITPEHVRDCLGFLLKINYEITGTLFGPYPGSYRELYKNWLMIYQMV